MLLLYFPHSFCPQKHHAELHDQHVKKLAAARQTGQSQGQLSGFVRHAPRVHEKMSKETEEYRVITECLVRMIGTTYQSLALVESKGFRSFVEALNPR